MRAVHKVVDVPALKLNCSIGDYYEGDSHILTLLTRYKVEASVIG